MNINKEWDVNSIKHYKTVEHIKKQLRKSNARYLSHHPEIRAIIRVFLHQAIDKRPKNIFEFAANLFNLNNSHMLVTMVTPGAYILVLIISYTFFFDFNQINQQLKRVNALLKQGRWTEYDGELFFGDKRESTHSIHSKSSIGTTTESILKYGLLMEQSEESESQGSPF